jgi:hypothetical protein
MNTKFVRLPKGLHALILVGIGFGIGLILPTIPAFIVSGLIGVLYPTLLLKR